jgi:hypothetical protein
MQPNLVKKSQQESIQSVFDNCDTMSGIIDALMFLKNTAIREGHNEIAEILEGTLLICGNAMLISARACDRS